MSRTNDELLNDRAGDTAVSAPKKASGGVRRARTIVLLAVFLSVVVGLIASNGWGTLSSMGIGAIAYICPVGALETLVAGHSPVLRLVLSLVCVLAVVALLGRAFCAWACPVPPLRRFFHPNEEKKRAKATDAAEVAAERAEAAKDADVSRAAVAPLTAEESAALSSGCSEKTHGKTTGCGSCSTCGLPPVGGKRDGVQIDSRHGVLAGALLSSALFGFPVFCLVCPVGLSIAVVIGVYRALFEQDPTVSLLIFAAILLVEVVFFRKWCHKICPIGALMSLVGAKAPLLRPRVATSKCLREQGIDCRACVKACPEELDPHGASIPECTKCGLCAEACPTGAIRFRKRAGAGALEPAGGLRPTQNAQPAFSEELEFQEETAG